MIVFELICHDDHRYEAWFGSTVDFERQAGTPLLTCPVCGSGDIRKAPAGLHTARRKRRDSSTDASVDQIAAQDHVAAFPPIEQLWSAIRKVVEGAENVGERFPEEARRIYYGEAPRRSIRGRASREESEALRDEGIDVMQLPVPPTEDIN